MRLLIFFLGLLLIFLQWRLWFLDGGLRERNFLQRQITERKKENQALEKRNAVLEREVEDLKKYLDNGGRAILCFQDSGEKAHGNNFKNLLSDYGIVVNDDSVMRSVYYKYLHPKEVFIEEGVLVPDFIRKKVRKI